MSEEIKTAVFDTYQCMVCGRFFHKPDRDCKAGEFVFIKMPARFFICPDCDKKTPKVHKEYAYKTGLIGHPPGAPM